MACKTQYFHTRAPAVQEMDQCDTTTAVEDPCWSAFFTFIHNLGPKIDTVPFQYKNAISLVWAYW